MASVRPVFPLLAALGLALSPAAAPAWGPHSEITRAAVDALPEADRLEARLGAAELERYSWLPDYRDAVLPDYSPNDFLLFPGFPAHVSHLTPAVRRTYAPFFRRAAQALRTESRANAARWTGSLLHFLQDGGSPPHAFPTSGRLHFRMENWVEGARVSIEGYRPRRLGKDVDSAISALEREMESRIAAARKIGEQVAPLCERGDRAAAEPLILDAARASSRISADALHTLLRLVPEKDRRGTARLEILVRAPKLPARPLSPVRLRLLGTPYETTSDPLTEATADYYRGRTFLRNLPPGRYSAELSRVGMKEIRLDVALLPEQTTRISVSAE